MGLVSELHEHGIISDEEKDELLSTKRLRDRRRRFLSVLHDSKCKTESPYKCFLEALVKTNHQLKEQLENKKQQEDEEEANKRLELKLKVLKHKPTLIEETNASVKFLYYFEEEGLLLKNDTPDIKELSRAALMERILNVLLNRKFERGKRPFEFLLEALRKNDQADLAAQVEAVEITEEDRAKNDGRKFTLVQMSSLGRCRDTFEHKLTIVACAYKDQHLPQNFKFRQTNRWMG